MTAGGPQLPANIDLPSKQGGSFSLISLLPLLPPLLPPPSLHPPPLGSHICGSLLNTTHLEFCEYREVGFMQQSHFTSHVVYFSKLLYIFLTYLYLFHIIFYSYLLYMVFLGLGWRLGLNGRAPSTNHNVTHQIHTGSQ